MIGGLVKCADCSKYLCRIRPTPEHRRLCIFRPTAPTAAKVGAPTIDRNISHRQHCTEDGNAKRPGKKDISGSPNGQLSHRLFMCILACC